MRITSLAAVVGVLLASAASARLRASSLEPLPIYSTVPLWVPVDLPDVASQFKVPRPSAAVAVNCTTTLASPSTSTFQTGVNNMADAGTLCITGTVTLTGNIALSNSKGISIVGSSLLAGGGTTTINMNGNTIGMPNGEVTGTNTKAYRVGGFSLAGHGGSGFVFWFYGAGTLTNLRLDHNIFTGQTVGDTLIILGEGGTEGNFYGVIDHNDASNAQNVAFIQMLGPVFGTPPASPFGTTNNMFIEDNTVTIATLTDGTAGTGCIDGWLGQGWVIRHNTFTNCLPTQHGATHGGGPALIDFSDNTTILNSGSSGSSFATGYRAVFHHQGAGEFIAYRNTLTRFSNPRESDALSVADYCAYTNCIDNNGSIICDGTRVQHPDGDRSPTATYRGYPCWHQPGRDFAASPVGGNLKPIYVWGNTWSDDGAKIDMTIETGLQGGTDWTAAHLQLNRDVYNAVSANAQTSSTSPFDGSSGMGFGTLARRPSNCTPTPEAADAGAGGVGYFATDDGARGTLYRCSATNTWTSHYVPAVYPHARVTAGT